MPIKLENASKRTGNRWLFRDVSFEVADGEVFGILGKNGAGKAEILASIDGSALTKPSLFARLFGNTSEPDSFEKISTKLEKSAGPVVLHDPFYGLDLYRTSRLVETIQRDSREKSLPVLLSASRFDDILAACDRAAVLADGYIQQIGTPQELYDAPTNRIAASLTGRVNLIEARRLSSSKSDVPEFQTIDGEHRLYTQKVELKTLGAINKNAYLAIRPEQIVLSFGASFPEDNLLKAVIAAIDFRGPVTYVRLNCSGLELEAMVTRLVGLNIGDECMVGLPPDRIRVLAA